MAVLIRVQWPRVMPRNSCICSSTNCWLIIVAAAAAGRVVVVVVAVQMISSVL